MPPVVNFAVGLTKYQSSDHLREEFPVGLEADNLEQQLEARDPDVRLMVQVRNDVAGAFETLVERYQNRLVGILFHLVGNREEEIGRAHV